MAGDATRCTSLAALMLALAGHAEGSEAQKVDADFLEFLGSDDSDDENWSALLAASHKASATEKGTKADGKKVEPADKKVQPAEPKKGES